MAWGRGAVGSSLSSQRSSQGLWSPLPPAGLVLDGVGAGAFHHMWGKKAPIGACLAWPGAGPGFWPIQKAVGLRTPLRSPSRVVTASCWSCLGEEAV